MQVTRTQKNRKDFEIKSSENIMICTFKAIHYCWLDVFENFRNMCLVFGSRISITSSFRKGQNIITSFR